jgi:hypothetical protein
VKRAKNLLQIGVCFVCDNKDLGYIFAASSPRAFFYFPSFLFPSGFDACYSQLVQRSLKFRRNLIMEWTTPRHEEIDLNCEVSSYANAEL